MGQLHPDLRLWTRIPLQCMGAHHHEKARHCRIPKDAIQINSLVVERQGVLDIDTQDFLVNKHTDDLRYDAWVIAVNTPDHVEW